jgi:ABC-2 type transport system ATP-binding protein
MTAAIVADHAGKRYGRRWALQDCSLEIPAGRVVGLVGANGAGKTTLLHLVVGLLTPTAGNVTTLGGVPGATPDALARVGFLAQDAPVYASLSVKDHLKLGARLNTGWDGDAAEARIDELELDRKQRAGTLSGGQRAQLALTLAVCKRPELLVLDEPVAGLDPLARREFLKWLMRDVTEHDMTVLLSSHLLADIERVCDYLVVLASSHVRLAGDADDLLAHHRRLVGPRRDAPPGVDVIDESHTERQSTFVVRTSQPIIDPAWSVQEIGLEDLVLAYLGYGSDDEQREPLRAVGGLR